MIDIVSTIGPLLAVFFGGVAVGVLVMSLLNVARYEADDDENLQLRVAYHDACREIARLKDREAHPIDIPVPPRSA